MLSGKTAAVMAVAILAVFGVITVETINNSGGSMTASSLTGTASSITVYSPQNGTAIPVLSANSSFNVSLSITSNDTSVYIYDISPLNVSSFQTVPGVQVSAIANLTHMNTTRYPYDYRIVNVTSGVNTTFSVTLYVNSTLFSDMKISSPENGVYHPYVVEMLVESSSGASGMGFTLIRL